MNLREMEIHFNVEGKNEGDIELYDGKTKSGEGIEIPFGSVIGKLLKDHLLRKKKAGTEKFGGVCVTLNKRYIHGG